MEFWNDLHKILPLVFLWIMVFHILDMPVRITKKKGNDDGE